MKKEYYILKQILNNCFQEIKESEKILLPTLLLIFSCFFSVSSFLDIVPIYSGRKLTHSIARYHFKLFPEPRLHLPLYDCENI